jgi:hypothetical protein
VNGMQMAPPAGGDIFGTIVVIVGALATLYAFVVAVRSTVSPGEHAPSHPKYLILEDDR